MKEPKEWDEEYLLNLPLGEFDWLEMKGRRSLDLTLPQVDENIVRETISKSVSAFANSGGGILVLGITFLGGRSAVDDGGVDLAIKKPTTREWLEDLIPNLVDPPLTSFNVYVVTPSTSDSLIGPHRGIFIVHIADSLQAPHQAIDNKYYGRVAGKSKPLGNRFVIDIVHRSQYPRLSVDFFYGAVNEDSFLRPQLLGSHPVLITVLRNSGMIYAKYVNIIVFIRDYLLDSSVAIDLLGGTRVELDDNLGYFRVIRENVVASPSASELPVTHSAGRYSPILPGRSHYVMVPLIDDFMVKIRYFKEDNPTLNWEVYADVFCKIKTDHLG